MTTPKCACCGRPATETRGAKPACFVCVRLSQAEWLSGISERVRSGS